MDYTMEDTQDTIDDLEWLRRAFSARTDTMTLFTTEVQKICSAALDASNIRHAPITSRVKSWESAHGSLLRRQHERILIQRLKSLVESKGRRWEEYARETGLSLNSQDTKLPDGSEDMLATLHDFSGVRISLYFPGDLEKVAAVLEQRFDIVRRTDKGHRSGIDVQSLEERFRSLEDPKNTNQSTLHSKRPQQSIRTFTGYKATHFVVRLRDEYLADINKFGWMDVVGEIQVGTLVMHVWSEIEHDMIYKPLDSQGAEVSEDEKRILDVINGIVLTGEAALRQLEVSTAKRLNKRAEDDEIMASSHYELATWVEKYFETPGKSLEGVGSEWGPLEKVFTILKAAGRRKHIEVTQLIDYAARKTSSRRQLPEEMIWGLCEIQAVDSKWDKPNTSTSPASIAKEARLCALHLVHSINLAMYLDVVEEFLGLAPLPCQVSFSSFLDILHPGQPQYSSIGTAFNIIKCCRAVIDYQFSSTLAKVATQLPTINEVGSFTESGVPRTPPVPGILTRLFPVEQDAEEGKKLDDTGELYHVLDLIDLYVSSEGQSDKAVIWDLLTAQPLNAESKNQNRDRFFVPAQNPGDMPFGRWRLAHTVQVNIEKINSNDVSQETDPNQMRLKTPDGVLRLAYHLYPREQWEDVGKALYVIKGLRHISRKRLRQENDQLAVTQ
ncbi:uncharacterized protein N7500_003074 [Penicillium coprophilum]|uniref:uncharacterized protein n=1 Tax=Penicillium coprophilum TaxID=36646 RepID=UPI00239B472E|nr:uncharacterized protein N7500_003074 [Penicillium coprophilum]KAJ5170291.1 hypothetical protein N7500_003074 [Penicillium coprophilum]